MTAKKSLLSVVAGIFSATSAAQSAKSIPATPLAPPVDLNIPVTNPSLVAAMRKHQVIHSNETASELFAELKKANLLVAAIMDKPINEARRSGVVIEKGEKIGFVEVRDDNNKRLLALFTDHSSLQHFTTEANSTFVMPTKQAMSFVLEQGFYDGLVVNPGSDPILRLDSGFIRQVVGAM